MGRNSSGVYTPPSNSFFPAINGTLATAGDWNQTLADLTAALTDSLSRGGNGGMTANLNMTNNKIVGLSPGTGAGQAAEFNQLFGAGVMNDIASAATVDIGAQNTSFLRMTGTTTVTSFGTNYRGPRFITFEGSLTLTNSSTLVLPGNANITTAAGDTLIVIPGATAGTADKWVVTAYQKNIVPGSAVIPDGSITAAKLADTAAVKLTLDQTIAGVKTFSSSPVVPEPTTAGQAVNKSYADNVVSTSRVLTATAAAEVGAVGTYAFLVAASATNPIGVVAGTTYAGSLFRYSGVSSATALGANTGSGGFGSTPSGTWRAMGFVGDSGSFLAMTLFLRIS